MLGDFTRLRSINEIDDHPLTKYYMAENDLIDKNRFIFGFGNKHIGTQSMDMEGQGKPELFPFLISEKATLIPER